MQIPSTVATAGRCATEVRRASLGNSGALIESALALYIMIAMDSIANITLSDIAQYAGGIGVAAIAIKAALVLYESKEKATGEYHSQLIGLTRELIEVSQASKSNLEKLEHAMQSLETRLGGAAQESAQKVGEALREIERGISDLRHSIEATDRAARELKKS